MADKEKEVKDINLQLEELKTRNKALKKIIIELDKNNKNKSKK